MKTNASSYNLDHCETIPKLEVRVGSGDANTTTPYSVNHASVIEVEENEYVASCEVSIPISAGIQPFSSIESERDENAIIANLQVTYFYNSTTNEIKITGISGGWRGSIMSLEIKDRTVSITDGVGAVGFGSKSHTWHPTDNTFSYSTGWGYVDYYPHSAEAMCGPRAYSEAFYRIPGMGSWEWQNAFLFMEVIPANAP